MELKSLQSAAKFSSAQRYRLYLLVLPLAIFDSLVTGLANEPSVFSGASTGLLKILGLNFVFYASSSKLIESPLTSKEFLNKSFSSLPKVFIAAFLLDKLLAFASYSFGSSVFSLLDDTISIGLAPVTLVVSLVFGFLACLSVWAPFFCAGEELVSKQTETFSSFFSGKQPHEVGFSRSSALFVGSRVSTLVSVLVVLSISVAPAIFATTPVLSVFVFYFLLARLGPLAVYLFFSSLPSESLQEIGIVKLEHRRSIFGNKILFGVFILLAFFTAVFAYRGSVVSNTVPSDAQFEVVSLEQIDDELLLNLELSNPGAWFKAERVVAYWFPEKRDDWTSFDALSSQEKLVELSHVLNNEETSGAYISLKKSFRLDKESGYVLIVYQTLLPTHHIITEHPLL